MILRKKQNKQKANSELHKVKSPVSWITRMERTALGLKYHSTVTEKGLGEFLKALAKELY